MTTRPILFSTPMVRALLAQTKVQTRRGLTISGHRTFTEFGVSDTGGYDWHFRDSEKRWHDLRDAELKKRLPWQVGANLWVRETWKPGSWRYDGRVAADYRASPEMTKTPWCYPDNFDDLWPKWTEELDNQGLQPDDDGMYRWKPGQSPLKWRPSIHMPRWASRLTLTVTDVRVQRLQDISEEDALAEGIEDVTQQVASSDRSLQFWRRYKDGAWNGYVDCPKGSYASLWESLNGPGSWSENPWIVALTFSVERRNVDEVGK
jgi:hypothetical protein